VGFDSLFQSFPGDQLFHLHQEFFSPRGAAFLGIFGFGKADLIHVLVPEKSESILMD